MPDRSTHLRDLLADRLVAAKFNVERIIDSALEIVVFGSRAIGVHLPSSDLDVLILKETGTREKTKSRGLDCICLSKCELNSSYWQGSELMSHVARYGTWLKGEGRWRSKVAISPRAVMNKERRIIALARGFESAFSKLHPVFHGKYRTMIRRELQRLDLLRQGISIPPTRILDFEWHEHRICREQLLSLAANLTQTSEYKLVCQLLSSSQKGAGDLSGLRGEGGLEGDF